MLIIPPMVNRPARNVNHRRTQPFSSNFCLSSFAFCLPRNPADNLRHPMPSDPLAIALEHHRAGRVRQAAAAYRALIEENPNHADALNWLGVLAFQSGRPDHAIPLLERAAK